MESKAKSRWYVWWIRHVRMEGYESKSRGCIGNVWTK